MHLLFMGLPASALSEFCGGITMLERLALKSKLI